ncbi:hypothetical protein IKG33_00675 [Candidatus Saccharibacteria bacterium]|nr:hypothetical protein [Candidatus Saccharibacteria bacterium]
MNSEKIGSKEQEQSGSENAWEKMEFPEFKGSKSVQSEESERGSDVQSPLEDPDEIRKKVLESYEIKKVDSNEIISQMVEGTKDILGKVPDNTDELDAWIDRVDNLPSEYADELSKTLTEKSDEQHVDNLEYAQQMAKKTNFGRDAFVALSKKHGGDMSSETRKKAYGLVEEYYKEQGHAIGVDSLLESSRRNIIATENNQDFEPGDKAASISAEKDGMKMLEDLAVEHMPDLSAHDKEESKKGLQNSIAVMKTIIRMEEGLRGNRNAREVAKTKEKIKELAQANGLKIKPPYSSEAESIQKQMEDYLFYDGEEYLEQVKRQKFLFEQARREKAKVTGFFNGRKLKQPENYLPESFDEILKHPLAYPEDKLRDLSMQFVRMQ